MSEKSTFHETKEVVSRLKEPLKIKAVAVSFAKERGHMLEITSNLSWADIDTVEKDMTDLINAHIRLIEGPMQSKYLGMIKDESQ
jgi:hypothetical protein